MSKKVECQIAVRSFNDIVTGINGIPSLRMKASELPDYNPDFYVKDGKLFVSLHWYSNGSILLMEDNSTQGMYLVGGRPPRRPQTPTFPDVPKPI